jgi:ATP-dependent DNA helicase RecQ
MKGERLIRLGHDELSTWGIGSDQSTAEWMSYIRQLIHQGLLIQDIGNFSVLKLAEAARAVLRSEQTVQLAKPRGLKRGTKERSKRRASYLVAELSEEQQALFAALRSVRTQIAKRNGVPPYMVFGDKTLKQMALERPQSPDAFLGLHGVGERKLDKYGSFFLDVIASFD